jgi:hypothetical protein
MLCLKYKSRKRILAFRLFKGNKGPVLSFLQVVCFEFFYKGLTGLKKNIVANKVIALAKIVLAGLLTA